VISKRTGSTWEREIGALIMANSLKGDTRTRDLLEYTILITKQVRKPNYLTNDIIFGYANKPCCSHFIVFS